VPIYLFALWAWPAFLMFFGNNSSAIRRTQILMTGLLLPDIFIGQTQILGGQAP